MVGVGNIYANESLFRAGIRPTVAGAQVRPRLERLVAEVREVLIEAIAKGGSTLRDYVDARGQPGYFQLNYFVYGREGNPAGSAPPRSGMRRLGTRASFYCPAASAKAGPIRAAGTGRRSAASGSPAGPSSAQGRSRGARRAACLTASSHAWAAPIAA